MASSISTAGGIKSDPATWLDRYGDVLFRYAVARVQDQMVAEDLVQEALLAAFSAADSFKGGSTEQTWLVGILRHKVMDYLRKVARERRLQAEWAEDAIEDNDSFDKYGHWRAEIDEWAAPEDSLEQAEFWQAFDACLGQLPEPLRVLFALRELDGMDSDVLIETMNISSKNNLWAMLSRARQKIRKCLHAQWFTGR